MSVIPKMIGSNLNLLTKEKYVMTEFGENLNNLMNEGIFELITEGKKSRLRNSTCLGTHSQWEM